MNQQDRQSERKPLDERRLEQFKAEDERIASTMRTYGDLLVENAELRKALSSERSNHMAREEKTLDWQTERHQREVRLRDCIKRIIWTENKQLYATWRQVDETEVDEFIAEIERLVP